MTPRMHDGDAQLRPASSSQAWPSTMRRSVQSKRQGSTSTTMPSRPSSGAGDAAPADPSRRPAATAAPSTAWSCRPARPSGRAARSACRDWTGRRRRLSWKAPTDSTIGQSARAGQCSRRSAASRTKALIADRLARAAASHTGVAAVEADLDDRPGQAEQDDREPELEVGDFVAWSAAKDLMPRCKTSPLEWRRYAQDDITRALPSPSSAACGRRVSISFGTTCQKRSTLAVPVVQQARAERRLSVSRDVLARPAPCSTRLPVRPSRCAARPPSRG